MNSFSYLESVELIKRSDLSLQEKIKELCKLNTWHWHKNTIDITSTIKEGNNTRNITGKITTDTTTVNFNLTFDFSSRQDEVNNFVTFIARELHKNHSSSSPETPDHPPQEKNAPFPPNDPSSKQHNMIPDSGSFQAFTPIHLMP